MNDIAVFKAALALPGSGKTKTKKKWEFHILLQINPKQCTVNPPKQSFTKIIKITIPHGATGGLKVYF